MAKPSPSRLNGKSVRLDVDGERTLLWVLRTDFGLTGTKFGCGEGYCGACTVLVDGEPVRSCQSRSRTSPGKTVVTIEGLAKDGRLHPVQEAFIKHEAMQCGFCTSGMILDAVRLAAKNPQPTRAGHPQGHGGQSLPLRHAHPRRPGDRDRGRRG